MGTFAIHHPDVIDFIKAKREDGRLRQFNLSLLITDEFMDAVKYDEPWDLYFPTSKAEMAELGLDPEDCIYENWPIVIDDYLTNSKGYVLCRVYETVQASDLWNLIMRYTYDFAEPGFILIDKVNKMNNLWFCEDIRATNPCVTADTWVHTVQGPKQVKSLIGQQTQLVVDGETHLSGVDGFFKTAEKETVMLTTKEGHSLNLTNNHRVRKVTALTRSKVETQWCEAQNLEPGDHVLMNNHRGRHHWSGQYNDNDGYLIGLLVGDGTLKTDKAVLSVWEQPGVEGSQSIMERVLNAARQYPTRSDFAGWTHIKDRDEYRLSFAGLKKLAHELGMGPGDKCIGPEIESASSDFYRGFLQGFFDADGSVQGNQDKGVSVRLAQSDLTRLEAVQRMLLRLGINSTIYQNRRPSGTQLLPNGKGGKSEYNTKTQHELVISNDNLEPFSELIGFADSDKHKRLQASLQNYQRSLNRERFIAKVDSLIPGSKQAVFDVQVPGINTFDANGFHAHNCGEQPLPPYGSCLLGSINLTTFIVDPFTTKARFDWSHYRKVVRIFTRMLDNVVELNGLPLSNQVHEITSKRRHGMGYLGLGSTITMLGMKYGDEKSVDFTEKVTYEMAREGWLEGANLADEKGPAPIFKENTLITQELLLKNTELGKYHSAGELASYSTLFALSEYMTPLIKNDLIIQDIVMDGRLRFTHHTSIAPTGTIALSFGNNVSNGIEPSFAHHYSRNVIREGKKTKEKVDVYSYELLAYRALIDPDATPEKGLPDYFITADDITPDQHIAIQAAAQKWVDSSISKTANVPTDYPFEDFKDIYLKAYEQGLKGCTTFRFNPEAFQGVLVKDSDLENTTYKFTLDDGSTVELKGNEIVEYDGEEHTAANLFDAMKEGYYGKL